MNPAALSIKRTKPSIEIVDLTERTGLGSIAVDRNRLVLRGLDDKVGDHAPVVWVHPGTVGVERCGPL